MGFAMAVLMLFVGSTLLWVATHGTTATSPWQVYQQIIAKLSAS